MLERKDHDLIQTSVGPETCVHCTIHTRPPILTTQAGIVGKTGTRNKNHGRGLWRCKDWNMGSVLQRDTNDQGIAWGHKQSSLLFGIIQGRSPRNNFNELCRDSSLTRAIVRQGELL